MKQKTRKTAKKVSRTTKRTAKRVVRHSALLAPPKKKKQREIMLNRNLTEAERQYVPVMLQRTPPGDYQPGPYLPVLVPERWEMTPKPAAMWVRVVEGDDRNGIGVIHQIPTELEPAYSAVRKVRYAGGTNNTPPVVVEKY